MEFREAYVAQAAEVIDTWSESNRPTSYAGYWVDHPQGGKLRIGFTEDQSGAVSQLEPLLAAPTDRVTEFTYEPTHSLDVLEDTEENFVDSLDSNPSVQALVTRTEASIPSNKVSVGTVNTSTLNSYVDTQLGANAPFVVHFEPSFAAKRIRDRPLTFELWAGDRIAGPTGEGEAECSLGFGATELRKNKQNGAPVTDKFAFTAGHCYIKNGVVKQVESLNGEDVERDIGTVWRRTFFDEYGDFVTDGEIIKLESDFRPPRSIYLGNDYESTPVKGAEKLIRGSTLCTSGITTGVTACGRAKGPFRVFYGGGITEWVVGTTAFTDYGDSGGAVWNNRNGKAVGLVSGGPEITPSEPGFRRLGPLKRAMVNAYQVFWNCWTEKALMRWGR